MWIAPTHFAHKLWTPAVKLLSYGPYMDPSRPLVKRRRARCLARHLARRLARRLARPPHGELAAAAPRTPHSRTPGRSWMAQVCMDATCNDRTTCILLTRSLCRSRGQPRHQRRCTHRLRGVGAVLSLHVAILYLVHTPFSLPRREKCCVVLRETGGSATREASMLKGGDSDGVP